MSQATWYTGDALETLRTLPSESVDLVLTSPPFLALRSYLPADHPDKQRELGSEASPGEFVDGLMLVVEECRRVLAPHGSIALELGDTYAGSGGAGGDYGPDGLREGQPKFRQMNPNLSWRMNDDGTPKHDSDQRASEAKDVAQQTPMNGGRGWPLNKSLSLIPETVRFTMVYGFNPHTGRTTEPWRLRNVVRWCRPNPPVGALGDKYRPATTDMAIFAKDAKRFFDLDAVRQPYSENSHARPAAGAGRQARTAKTSPDGNRSTLDDLNNDGAGAPPLDYWVVPTQPYKGSHYATWPRRLLDVPIRSMVPQKVCEVCGKPSERIVDANRINQPDDSTRNQNGQTAQLGMNHPPEVGWEYARTTVGWSDCGHNQWRNGIVLDPFAGSGTTLEVATGLGRDAIGIDLDERNYQLAVQRVGMFLTHA